MERNDLLRHLGAHGCRLLREGGKHSIFINDKNANRSSVPRHLEIASGTALRICRQLEIPVPEKR
ncbi:MAG: type II toxin-antitoxin system HicA family toxin [Acidobacteria bacterium]|nr:type II toxin-antitoxin system HicA family toxin [Acidobacteriota bacterium]